MDVWSFGFALILVTVLILVVVLINHVRLQRRKVEEQERKESKRSTENPRVMKDPWVEAGKRAGTPSSTDLEQGVVRSTRAPATSPAFSGPSSRSAGRPVALVTGAARRVGREIAKKLARAGCDIYFTYHQSSEEAESLARELSELGSTGSFHQVDFGDAAQVEALGRDLAGTIEKLDVLVHNASVYTVSPLSDLTIDDVMRQYQINAAAPLVLTARLAPLLMQSDIKGGGAVIAVS